MQQHSKTSEKKDFPIKIESPMRADSAMGQAGRVEERREPSAIHPSYLWAEACRMAAF